MERVCPLRRLAQRIDVDAATSRDVHAIRIPIGIDREAQRGPRWRQGRSGAPGSRPRLSRRPVRALPCSCEPSSGEANSGAVTPARARQRGQLMWRSAFARALMASRQRGQCRYVIAKCSRTDPDADGPRVVAGLTIGTAVVCRARGAVRVHRRSEQLLESLPGADRLRAQRARAFARRARRPR